MNQILVRQNEPSFLERLAAQRQLYDEEKRLITLWIVISGFMAVLGTGALALLKVVNAYITLMVILVMIAEFVFLYIIRKRGHDAARIQESFDCDLLEMPWNDMLAKKPEPAIITSAAERFRQHTSLKQQESLKDWYNKRINGMPLHLARIYCQEENIGWDLRQRNEYIIWISVALGALLVTLVAFSIGANFSAQDFFVGPVLLSSPVFYAGATHIRDHYLATQRLRELKQKADEMIEKASQPAADEAALAESSRNLQTEIYHHRADNSPVFSWFYEAVKKKHNA